MKALRYNTPLPECKSTATAFGPNYEDCGIVFPVGDAGDCKGNGMSCVLFAK